MRKRIQSIVLLVVVLATSTAFSHTATLKVDGENRYKALRLTPEIYQNANEDLSDLLIEDSKGETIPYFINRKEKVEQTDREVYSMELINAYTKEDNFYFDYKIAMEKEADTLATSIEMTTSDTDFAKVVEIYGSYDNLHWEFIQSDKLYAIDNAVKLDITFEKAQKYTHYRFQFANNLESISFEQVELVYQVNGSEENYFIEKSKPLFRTEEKEKTTFLQIQGLKNLRLCDIKMETDSMFKRNAELPMGFTKEIYNLSWNDISYHDTTIPLNGEISKEDVLVIKIRNYDDKPIVIKDIVVRYYADEIVFEGKEKENYTLSFGADETKIAPIYDMEKYKDEIIKNTIDQVEISEIIYGKEEEKWTEETYKIIFNSIVIGTTILLAALILRRLKRREE